MANFKEFVDKKTREAVRQLNVVKGILEKSGMVAKEFFDEDEPYVFLRSPKNDRLSFDGVRIYKIGNNLAYRIQKEEKTHPYGKAYPLNIEDMFDDFISDNIDEEKAGKKVIEAVVNEFNKFFEKSAMAEKDLRVSDFEKRSDPLDSVAARSTGTDYSLQVHKKGN